MNIIRNLFSQEIEELKPLLRRAYKSIYDYQNNRNEQQEEKLREDIRKTLPFLTLFKEHIPAYKQRYIDLLEDDTKMKPYDLIICFDRAIYELHTRVESGQWANLPWSKELRDLLNERQQEEDIKENKEEIFLTAGLAASRGNAIGKACIVRSVEDFAKVKLGDILVTPMTDPNFIQVMDKVSGLITDRGGKVSHAAILAREFNIPCVVGCKNATKVIEDGQWIRLDTISGLVMEVT